LYTPEECKPLDGLIFNSITQYASSRVVFAITLTLLVVWAIVGAILGAPESWETIMQNASSIRYYVSDS
jgi:low-affinity ferrous iron transport protein